MTKVLFLIETLGRGGAEQALVNLLPALAARGYLCEVGCLNPPHDLAEELEAAGTRVHRLGLSGKRDLIGAVGQLKRLIREGNFQIVHSNLFFPNVCLALCPIFSGSWKRVVTFHSLEFDREPASDLKAWLRHHVYRWMLKFRFHARIAVSLAVQTHFDRYLGAGGKKTVLPNPLPSSLFFSDQAGSREEIRSRFGVAPNDFLIVCPARLIPEKGHAFLIEAISALQAKVPPVKLLLFGDGPLLSQIQAQIAHYQLASTISLHASVPQHTLHQLIEKAELTVMPSLSEGFGMAVAEACALGCPVVASRVGGLSEIIDDQITGLLVPPRDPSALAAAIQRLHEDSGLAHRLGQNGKQKVRRLYAAPEIAAALDEFYQQL